MDSKTLSSRLRELVKFLGTVKGDLANVTGPPSLLAPLSVVEVGHCWAERPSVFAAPALEPNPSKRALLVLRWFLTALRSQLYIGVDHHHRHHHRQHHHTTTAHNNNKTTNPKTQTTAAAAQQQSIRKPLNAFLGELFLATWTDESRKCTTELVAEQVSHHPPITAMHVVDREHGVRADGYARVEMSFNGSVNIRQVGHAVLRVDRFEEDYLIPLPDVKVRGFLSGSLYPEISGTYHIVGSGGFVTELKFRGEGLVFRGKRNAFEARVYHKGDASRRGLYEVAGCWSEGWTVKDCSTGELVEVYEVDAPENDPVPMDIEPVDAQDPWESRRAWDGVLRGLRTGDMRLAVDEKTKIEQAQRQMRASEAKRGVAWEPLFFRSRPGEEHDVFHRLSEGLGWQLHYDKTKGVWRVDDHKVQNMQRPFRGDLTPYGY
ncbi:hypothetical protein N657DRAFT_666108 [Parathielavia appendiculata]|uniref:Oxysterol-binding protein n=1 Tax=Parathielavia appendiculata TaxID=2587402 RepID=A0AAN6TTM9_9PEZI|nr:hypothetical protein N657DRAFT_666108 [Parathielavia appendiculata]